MQQLASNAKKRDEFVKAPRMWDVAFVEPSYALPMLAYGHLDLALTLSCFDMTLSGQGQITKLEQLTSMLEKDLVPRVDAEVRTSTAASVARA